MKQLIENIIKATINLNDGNQKYVIKQLKEILYLYTDLSYKSQALKNQITGIQPPKQNDALVKAISILKLHGYDNVNFDAISPDFLNWFIDNTIKLPNFKPKLINYYLLSSMQQAYYITCAQKLGEQPTYREVKQNLIHFEDVIKEYEQESKLTFDELIQNIHGTN